MEHSSQQDGTRQRRHFGRRKGPALSAYQAGLLETLLPRLRMEPETGRDPCDYFAATLSEVWLEIGFGGGEHLLWQAQGNPRVGIIGAEPYVSGVAKLLSKIASPSSSLRSPPPPHAGEENPPPVSSPVHGRGVREADGGGISNIRLYTEDASDIIAALPDACLGRVFVLFPDPWPKTRHHKRRFIQMATLDELARVMKPGAELRFATDDNGYLVWTLERLSAHSAFAWLAESANDWRARPPDWPETRYEAKAKRAGSTCTYLRFVRKQDHAGR